MHWFRFNIGDYKKDTDHLSLAEHGAYIKALSRYYLLEEPLPLEEEKLFRFLGVKDEIEKQAIRNILDDFFTKTATGFIHKRCDVEIEKYQEKSYKASQSSKVRWETKNDANAMRTHSDGNANSITQELNNSKTNTHTPEGVDVSVWKDYLKLRKAKRLPITDIALKAIEREAKKANKTLNDALTICVENNWIGFKSEWLNKLEPQKPKEVWGK